MMRACDPISASGTLIDMMSECLSEVPTKSMPLSTLGAKLFERRGTRLAACGVSGKIGKHVKEKVSPAHRFLSSASRLLLLRHHQMYRTNSQSLTCRHSLEVGMLLCVRMVLGVSALPETR